MIGLRNFAFYSLFIHVLAIVVTTSARSTAGLVPAQQNVLEEGPTYEMMITPNEEDRLVELLGPEYLDVGLVATRVTAPSRHCSVCGKQTEFVDWVFTALARGVHSPEFIVDSLKLGNSPKKLGHDVYCSRCGHLTHFRDVTGEEGSAPYIAIAPPYNRATRTFALSVFAKRSAEKVEDGNAPASPPPVWHTRWTRKRSEDASDASPPPVWHTRWTRKRGEDVSEASRGDPENVQPAIWRLLWTRKRGEEPEASEVGVPEDAQPAIWRLLWTRKRGEEAEASNGVEPSTTETDQPAIWRLLWTRKRDDEAEETFWRIPWAIKRGEDDAEVPGDAQPAIWRLLWTRKRSEEGEDACPASWSAHQWQVKAAEDDGEGAHNDTVTLDARCIFKRGEDEAESESEASAPVPDHPALWGRNWSMKRGEEGVTAGGVVAAVGGPASPPSTDWLASIEESKRGEELE